MSDKLTEAQLKRMAEFGNDPGRAGSSSVATELLAARALLAEAKEVIDSPTGYATAAMKLRIEEFLA